MLHFEILLVNFSVNWVKRKRIQKGIGECILSTNVSYSVDARHLRYHRTSPVLDALNQNMIGSHNHLTIMKCTKAFWYWCKTGWNIWCMLHLMCSVSSPVYPLLGRCDWLAHSRNWQLHSSPSSVNSCILWVVTYWIILQHI